MCDGKRNLLEETLSALADHGYTEKDVLTVRHGSETRARVCDWGWFKERAAKCEYDSGYGSQMINPSLKIIMRDGTWYERREYDGSEWWQHCAPPDPGGFFGGPALKADYWTRDYGEWTPHDYDK